MELLTVERATKTPKVFFDPKGYLLLEGRSVPENSTEFYYHPLLWMDEYFKKPQAVTTVEIKLEYFNTSSANIILKILRLLDQKSKEGVAVLVKWFYEEDDDEYLDEITSYQNIMKHLKIQPEAIEEFD